MQHHVDAVPFPKCPDVGCGYELCEDDLRSLAVDPTRLEAFQNNQLRNAVDGMAARTTADSLEEREVLIRCQDHECPNAVLMVLGTSATRFACSCGAPPFCTHCKQSPYHYHAACSEVQTLRQRWLLWLSMGREKRAGLERAVAEAEQQQAAALRQVEAMKIVVQRHKELESDEIWKARNCRRCPFCSRPVQKIEGCDSMLCGQDAHGGNAQPGCGLRFNALWTGCSWR